MLSKKTGAAALVVLSFLAGAGFVSTLGQFAPNAENVNKAVVEAPATSAPTSQLEPIELATLTSAPEPTDTTRPTVTGAPLPPKTSTPLATKTTTPPPTLTPTTIPVTPTSSPTQGPSAVDNANLRSGPDTAYPIVGAVVANQALDVIAKNPDGTWYQLASGAWIHGGLVRGVRSVSVARSIPPLPTPTNTPRPASTMIPVPTPHPVPTNPAPAARSCCKVCGSNSKPCGDSCISLNKTCRIGAGCAC